MSPSRAQGRHDTRRPLRGASRAVVAAIQRSPWRWAQGSFYEFPQLDGGSSPCDGLRVEGWTDAGTRPVDHHRWSRVYVEITMKQSAALSAGPATSSSRASASRVDRWLCRTRDRMLIAPKSQSADKNIRGEICPPALNTSRGGGVMRLVGRRGLAATNSALTGSACP
jgi:hypothetical protein